MIDIKKYFTSSKKRDLGEISNDETGFIKPKKQHVAVLTEITMFLRMVSTLQHVKISCLAVGNL